MDAEEARQLTGPAAPIVLLRATGEALPEAIAPGLTTLGFMLPTTPLHRLVLHRIKRPVVMTSGNVTDEPPIIDDREALERLRDMPILPWSMIGRSRCGSMIWSCASWMAAHGCCGLAVDLLPAALALPEGFAGAPDLLAVGGQSKSSHCIVADGRAIRLPDAGGLDRFADLFDHAPAAIATDTHSEYLSTTLARRLVSDKGMGPIAVQHHHAHIAACLAEDGHPRDAAPVLGIVLDGLGRGDDDTLWGGEFLLADYRAARRLATFKGSGASGGGCSVVFTAPLWQQNASGWRSIGCAQKRVVADVSADADPHTGIAVTDSSPACETEYIEGSTKHITHWCTYGGTSLASPIIASVFALAGGANGVEYPARTLYESERLTPGGLHDVTVGSNGECTSGFNAKTGLSYCEPSTEAAASCRSKGSCLAGTGFDGPSGVGTPHGIAAFEPGEDANVEETAPEEIPEETTPEEPPTEKPEERARSKEGTTVYPPVAPSSPSPAPVVTKASVTPFVSALGLTTKAVIALDARRPPASKVSFFYMLTAPARVSFTLARQVQVHHHPHWKSVGPSAGAAAAAGRNGGHLRGGTLSPASTALR